MREMCNPEDVLDLLIGETGKVSREYGGYTVEVHDITRFPWTAVIRTLLRINQQVWIEGREGRIVIVTKPKAD